MMNDVVVNELDTFYVMKNKVRGLLRGFWPCAAVDCYYIIRFKVIWKSFFFLFFYVSLYFVAARCVRNTWQRVGLSLKTHKVTGLVCGAVTKC